MSAKPTKSPLDPHTARCLRELRSVISSIEAGDSFLIQFQDLTDASENPLSRKLTIVAACPPVGVKP